MNRKNDCMKESLNTNPNPADETAKPNGLNIINGY